MTDKNALLEFLFRDTNQVSFQEYVNALLHHPEFGYYGKYGGKEGIEKDFYTAPTLTSAFGKCLSNFIKSSIRFFERDEKITLLDAGAGNGALLADTAFQIGENGNPQKSISFSAVEQNCLSAEKIRKKFFAMSQSVTIDETLTDLAPFKGVAIFNEFFDALPFARIKIENSIPEEVCVQYSQGNLREIYRAPLPHKLKEIYLRWFSHIRGDAVIEVCPQFEDILKVLWNKMDKGIVLIIDYGDKSEVLYGKHVPQGTMRCFRGHRINANPYDFPGEQDITFSVNFSEIAFQAKRQGFSVFDFTTMQNFLIRWGILDIVSALAGEGGNDIKKYNEIQKIKNLLLPTGMGTVFKVMLLGKGMFGNSCFLNDEPF